MLAQRYRNSSTNANLDAILDLLRHPSTTQLVLFASARNPTPQFSVEDGPTTNLPLVAALAKIAIPHADDMHVVMDGAFLTAARFPRYCEVQALLDACQNNPKAFFACGPTPFTASLEPAAAAATLLAIEPLAHLTSSSRHQYFALLSNMSEDALQRLYKTEPAM